MVLVSGEEWQLLPCSTSENKQVVIYYFRPDKELNNICLYACIPVDRLISRETPPSEVYRNFKLPELPRPEEGVYLNYHMSAICTPRTSAGAGKALYFFGGLGDPPKNYLYWLHNKPILKKVYCYDLNKLPKSGSVIQRKDMKYGMSMPLVVQVGTDFIYVLGYYAKTEFQNSFKPAFQKYNFKEDRWYDLSDDHFINMMNSCDCDEDLRKKLKNVPYVVIGHYLHVSIGNSSFTFDTVNNVWEDCKLFETFWSEREKKMGFSPMNFYGRPVCYRAIDVAEKKRKRAEYGGGPPFGFEGRGILYDGNILLGVHCAPYCPLVAFLYDDKTGRVVRSQRICFDEVCLGFGRCVMSATLLNLGRDGFFCVVHFVSDKKIDKEESAYTMQMELLTFQVSRLTAKETDVGGKFVKCEFVRKEFVAKECPDIVGNSYNAFCV